MHIVVVGLGYVGLPLAVALARSFDVTGLDIDQSRVDQLRAGHDRTDEVDDAALAASTLSFASAPGDCAPADVYIVTVPTPVDADNRPDLGLIEKASRMLAKMIDPARRPIVVYESTVYPGVTEDICGPIIEATGGLKRGRDFLLGYSPERINPGDRVHTVDRIVKIVAGENEAVTEQLAELYGKVTSAGIFKARSIKVAEGAKVIENAQRDINIAFMNEVARIFARMDISVWDVLEAANTKWNFLPFQPGLVGGHCIGVDPYYLAHRARELGHTAEVILAGRATNDGMGDWIAGEIHERTGGRGGRALVLGLTFKENVPDIRNSKTIDVINGLRQRGHDVVVHDPLADPQEARHEYGIDIVTALPAGPFDTVAVAVSHDEYRGMPPEAFAALLSENGLIADIKRTLGTDVEAAFKGRFWTL